MSEQDTRNPEDSIPLEFYDTLRLKIVFRNTTSGVEIHRSQRIELTEVGEKHLIFELPQAACNLDHNVMFEIYRTEVRGKPDELLFNSTGKVTTIEKAGISNVRASVSLLQFEDARWTQFLNLFSERQEAISNLLERIKG